MITTRQLAKMENDLGSFREKLGSIEKSLGEVNDKLDEVLKQNEKLLRIGGLKQDEPTVDTKKDKDEERAEKAAPDEQQPSGPTIS